MVRINSSYKEMPSKWRFMFRLILVILPIFIIVIFELLLRFSGYGDNLNLFVQNPKSGYENYLIVNPNLGKKYFQKVEYTAPANDIFLKEKPKNSFRIFIMGSSTVYGFPYDRNLMFSRILHKRLEEAYPTKKIEVINTAITAINSFTLLDYIDQILVYKPDAILIYAGHNEFYGAFGVGSNETMSRNRKLTQLHLYLMGFRVYQLIRNSISGVAQKLTSNSKGKVHGTLMKRIVADKDILLNSANYNLAMERYEQNMGDILKETSKKNVPVFLSELVCNVKDMKPFNSIATDNLESAMDVYNQAKIAEKEGEFESAFKLYYKAKDLDCIRFRASEDVNTLIKKLTKEYDVHLVPMLKYFQSHSQNKLIGNNLMTEHLHPNIEGNFLIAEAFFTEIANSKIMGEIENPSLSSIEYFKSNWGYTALDSLAAYHNVQQLKCYWPYILDSNLEMDYKKTYRPKSYLDSIAFSTLLNKEVKLADVRLELANKYKANGQIADAYCEYEALVCTNPYVAVNYRDAASCLIQLGDLPRALNYFEKSLEYEDSFFAQFKIAEIYLIMGDYDNAIRYFEKAYIISPDDKKINILLKLYIAFVYSNKIERAKTVASKLAMVGATEFLTIPPKSYGFTNYIPYKTRAQVEEAKLLIADRKNEEALVILEKSLMVYDSHIAKRIIGEIYLKLGDYDKSLYYLNKVFNQFKTDPTYLHELILIFKAKNDFASEKKYFEEIKRIDPTYEHLNQLSLLL